MRRSKALSAKGDGLAKARAYQRLDLDIEYRLQSALSHKADLEEAHEHLGQRYLKAHQDAERERNEAKADQSEIRLRHHALALPEANAFRQRTLHYLKGTGAVSLLTDVEGVEITLMSMFHIIGVWCQNGLLFGESGLESTSTRDGFHRLVLKKEGHHDVIYPVHIGRGEHWDGRDEQGVQRPVHLPKLGEVGADECVVPGGWFWCGGDPEVTRGFSLRRVWVDDFVMSRFPVTNRDYLVFLNSLLEQGREEEALQWVPRERAGQAGGLGALIYGRGEDGHFVLTEDAQGDVWDLDWPVCMVSWHCAEAYCRWRSEVKGVNYRLSTSLEWEKAAKGVDGRWHVWGDEFDASYCHMGESHPDQNHRLPVTVDSYPFDESVYGVRGLGGNMMDWTSSHYRADWKEIEDETTRVFRGGSWYNHARYARASYCFNEPPSHRIYSLGFRFARTL